MVVRAGDSYCLRRVPVRGREDEGGRRHRPFAGVARRHGNGHIGRRLAVEPHGEGGRTAGLGRHQSRRWRDRNSGRIVVGVRYRDVGRIETVVVRIAADGRGRHDRVSHIPVVPVIVRAGHGHRLRRVPVRGCKDEARWRDGTFARIVRGDGDRHIGRRLAVEPHGEGGRAAGFGRHQSRRWRDRNSGRIVVGVRYREVGRIEAVVVRIAADGRGRHDRVSHVPVVPVIVHAGHGHRLRRHPVCGREDQGG